MDRRNTLHETLQQRVYGGLAPDVIFKRARESKYLIQCLKRGGTLTGHDGCVNTITWSSSGELLLSGSDDCRLHIYRPSQHKLLQSIRSGHRANIFSAKFLPCASDRKIVSCAGDGMVHLTDLDRPERQGQCSFNCHVGTTYEVITTPGDPNTFLTCGEDGTVRMFDLRTKMKCTSRECKEDILIDCGKAVTSIGINPLAPYQLSVGCEDSTVGVFDCRSLSTACYSSSSNKMKGMVCKFRPDALNDRTCRVTSLQYSPDGGELLVSYCADYVYLFNMRGRKQLRLSPGGKAENGYHSTNGQRNNLPLKRLRLRGDWSDTGPNARPESEAPSAESSLMQRMSDMFVRWIEESFRANQQRRARTSSSRSGTTSSSPSMSPEPSPPYSSSTSSESTGAAELVTGGRQCTEGGTPRSSRTRQRHAEQAEGNAQDADTQTDPVTISRSVDSMDTEEDWYDARADTGSSETVSRESSVKHMTRQAEGSENTAGKKTGDEPLDIEPCEIASAFSTPDIVYSTDGQILARSLQDAELPDGNSTASPQSRGDDTVLFNEHTARHNHGHVGQPAGTSIECRESDTTGNEVKDLSVNLDGIGGVEKEEADDRNVQQGCGVVPSIVLEPRLPSEETMSDSDDRDRTHGEGAASLPENIPRDISGETRTRGEHTPSANVDMPGSSDGRASTARSSAATRIQRLYRQHRLAKAAKDEWEEEWHHGGSGQDRELWLPEMTQVYRGHRNARTMIKEAAFWGEQFVVSGSDCGRIFLWDKNTADIVMVLQGDRHVVNCVQPHPFDPVLASSGIDYDIKLWAPVSEYPQEVGGLEEIIKRNEKMLEESRDTITVPASFMLRMLASLNHARFARRSQDDSDSDTSDDE